MLDLRRSIKECGFTQRMVAEKMGITLTSLNQIMTGNPTYAKLKEVANAIGVDVVDLFYEEGKKKSTGSNSKFVCPNCGAELEIRKKE